MGNFLNEKRLGEVTEGICSALSLQMVLSSKEGNRHHLLDLNPNLLC